MPNFKIALCFSDTGGGHRSAVEAIEAGISEIAQLEPRGHQFDVRIENIVEETHPINRFFVDLYNFLLRHNQSAMRYYYWFVETFRPNDSELGYRLIQKNLSRFLDEAQPDVLVSVHPMCNHYLARALNDADRAGKTKLVTVVTDPNGNFWRGWACSAADLTLVPNELGKRQLIDWEVAKEKIQVVGMPVHPDFTKPPTTGAEEFRHHLGLYRHCLTVCLNAGWAGGGNMLAIYRQLQELTSAIQVIFLCGHNRRLYEQVKREAHKSHIPTAVLPFHDRMSDLMNAVDLMVTKAGGFTTFEALARRLPLAIDMITPPMPQEMGTVNIMIEQGLAFPIYEAEDILPAIDKFQMVADRLRNNLPAVHELDRTDAVYETARAIMGFCDPAYLPKPGRTAFERL
jgi:UDP-N-acetylglucosamine:LPS N-acetylglucosamine transferase